MDERIKTLARNLVNYSCKVGKGDKVYINYTGMATEDLARQLVKEVYEAGGIPFVHYINPKLQKRSAYELHGGAVKVHGGSGVPRDGADELLHRRPGK